MIIKEGFIGRRRDGQKIGPITANRYVDTRYSNHVWETYDSDGCRYTYNSNGAYLNEDESPFDILAEWADEPAGPVRAVTCKEIVPGNFNEVVVEYSQPEHQLRVYTNLFQPAIATELRAAAATLTEIADALDEQANGRAVE